MNKSSEIGRWSGLKINFKKEYLIITGLLLVIVFFSDFLRIILGLPFALFLPGYLLMAVLFPEKDEFDGSARIALSIGLSTRGEALYINAYDWFTKMVKWNEKNKSDTRSITDNQFFVNFYFSIYDILS